MPKRLIKIIPALLAVGILAAILINIRDREEVPEGILIEYADSMGQNEVVMREYGLRIDSFHIISGIIKRDQTLSTILYGYGVNNQTIHDLAQASEGIFDVRKIRQGKPYKLFCAKDSSDRAMFLVYEHTPVDYVMFSLADSAYVIRQEKEISQKEREVSGIITSSLWNTMVDQDLDPMLAFELSEIYAWSIDFFGLMEGDAFKLYFDEQYVDTNYIGLGKIHGAVFHHAQNEFYAIPFVQDSIESFFDQEGQSLRKAFLKAPLRFSRISSRYSYSRLHPILKIRRPHLGVDYAAPVGTPVHAIGDGRINKTGYTKGNGKWIKIQHNSVYATAYLHLSRYGKGIKQGAYVKQGDIIGYVGSTGLSTGPHLDFRFYKNGNAVDPLKVEAPPVEPVHEDNISAYDSVKAGVIARIAGIALPDSSETGISSSR
ncbi:MAG: peptidoglycan DD-metalloendopeptidase family protein [Bacteroidales bacterium]|nr:peptidoglycan DD-metalloendopeptidase family protein [Bacteroidales bacterium]